jgi:hypothetical protein
MAHEKRWMKKLRVPAVPAQVPASPRKPFKPVADGYVRNGRIKHYDGWIGNRDYDYI